MKKVVYHIFIALLILILKSEACVDTCTSWTTETTCAETCNECKTVDVADPSYTNKTITTLPFEFNYSQADLNPSNNTCSSTSCGTKTCTGTTTDSNKTIPTSWSTGACQLTPNNKLPAQLSCKYKDHYCHSYCTKWVTNDVCASTSCI
jgi:hypothetical protein